MAVHRAFVESKRDQIDLVRHHRGHSASLFGSVVRGGDTPESDIDFLVDFEPGRSLFDLMNLQEALEQLREARSTSCPSVDSRSATTPSVGKLCRFEPFRRPTGRGSPRSGCAAGCVGWIWTIATIDVPAMAQQFADAVE